MLSGQVAIVTGASRGIGRAIAEKLGEQGAAIIATATSEEGARRTQIELRAAGIEAVGLVLNMSDAEAIEPFLQEAQQYLGPPTVLVNNAGITRDGLMIRMKSEDWEEVIGTNLSAVFYLTKAVARPMMKAKGGRIINISSVVASTGNAGQTNYAAAKSGLVGLTRSCAQELAPRGITVNAVAPGFVETEMTRNLSTDRRQALIERIPLGRIGEPHEVAEAVAFLAGPGGSYITGATLHVNGGLYMG